MSATDVTGTDSDLDINAGTELTPSQMMSACLEVLAERVAMLVSAVRSDDDVDDNQRGVTFPRELIVRDALRGPDDDWPSIAAGLIPPRLAELGQRCGLSDKIGRAHV